MNFKEKYGPYAFITGASSGIGKEFALQLTEKGLNLILLARRKVLLEELAREIRKKNHVQVKTIELDLVSEHFMEEIVEKTKGLEVGLLVNNAGMIYIGNYLDNPIEKDLQMIDLNIKVPAVLTHYFVSQMAKRKKGGLINTGSILGFMGTPFSSTYAGTKAHEIVKTEGLAYELKPYGIDVLGLNPGLTETEMIAPYDFSGIPMKLMNPKKVVQAALEALGEKTLLTPGLMNKLMNWISKRIISRKMNTQMFGHFMKKTF